MFFCLFLIFISLAEKEREKILATSLIFLHNFTSFAPSPPHPLRGGEGEGREGDILPFSPMA